MRQLPDFISARAELRRWCNIEPVDLMRMLVRYSPSCDRLTVFSAWALRGYWLLRNYESSKKIPLINLHSFWCILCHINGLVRHWLDKINILMCCSHMTCHAAFDLRELVTRCPVDFVFSFHQVRRNSDVHPSTSCGLNMTYFYNAIQDSTRCHAEFINCIRKTCTIFLVRRNFTPSDLPTETCLIVYTWMSLFVTYKSKQSQLCWFTVPYYASYLLVCLLQLFSRSGNVCLSA
jgi:hypothetical protein